ncbi:MAG TPA: SCO family protein [Pseudoduganella sp.]
MISPNSNKSPLLPTAATLSLTSSPAATAAALGHKSSPWQTAVALACVAALGVAAVWHGTMGFRVVSTEEARRLAIAEQPRTLPLPAARDPAARVTLATFFYARCNAVCSAVGSEFQQLQSEILARGLQDRVRLLSISFDPRDGASELTHYAQRMRADGRVWTMTSVPDDARRASLLVSAGVVVIPAPLGEYEHNAAIHLIDRDGRLVRIVDYEQPAAALDAALALAQAVPVGRQ